MPNPKSARDILTQIAGAEGYVDEALSSLYELLKEKIEKEYEDGNKINFKEDNYEAGFNSGIDKCLEILKEVLR